MLNTFQEVAELRPAEIPDPYQPHGRRRVRLATLGTILAAVVGAATACSYGALPSSAPAAGGATASSVAASGSALPDINGQVCCVAVSAGAPSVVDGIATDYNGWDTAFITWMIPHFAVASQFAELAPGRSTNAGVKTLAGQIDQALPANYLKMANLAKAWGQPVPSTDPDAASGHDHGSSGASPADTAAALTKLKNKSFDKTYLGLVIADDKAAVQVAEATIANSVNPESKQLAVTITTETKKQLATAQKLLAGGE